MAINLKYSRATAPSPDDSVDDTSTAVAELWDPQGGEAVVTDDLADAEGLAGTRADGRDPLLTGLLTHQLIAGLIEAGPDEDVTDAILARLPQLPAQTADK